MSEDVAIAIQRIRASIRANVAEGLDRQVNHNGFPIQPAEGTQDTGGAVPDGTSLPEPSGQVTAPPVTRPEVDPSQGQQGTPTPPPGDSPLDRIRNAARGHNN